MPFPSPARPERGSRLAALATDLAEGTVSSLELVEEALRRMASSGPTLNAFVVVRADAARAEAARADRRLQAGERAPLLGVPVAVKDDTDVTGEPTAFGCRGSFPPAPDDAGIVRRLRAAGAVIVGKTTTPELGQWPFTEGAAFGRTANPWSVAHSPGGSSGGSAAAVAAGVVPVATGSDGAGSVRIPAAWTGLVGVKPSRGRVSTWPDAEAFQGITTHGVLARSVADAALVLDVITGTEPGERHHLADGPAGGADGPGGFVAAASRPPGRLRIALSTAIPYSIVPTSLHPHVEAAVRRLAEELSRIGHDVVEADPHYGLVGLSFLPRSHFGLYEWAQRVPDQALLDPRTRANCANGRLARGPVLAAARASERWFARRIGAMFQDLDVVLAPTTAAPPLALGSCHGLTNTRTDRVIAGACPYAWPWNVLGYPGVNVPAGLTPERLPVGATLVGPPGAEARLLSLAAQLEEVERWDLRRPPLRFPEWTGDRPQ